ncbi:toxin co-regulated pilus biosynthesis Q family protein [Pandoraea sputorum]|uniref:Toxin co-regulated pilus biosynthesis protein Q n=1 Tax=Pandoraea sputorum TaxID=93222 RepID=A0A239S6H6_9BURK|nr:toxin co-regulated pilus biosynthesis Q family protein [Pandoraea sputorum]SNU81021.1 Toxin co-regulated pilus biosynthesis protein Q [Pandoraea sputorum]VVD71773.1 type IV pilus assembly protein [Pandoraea sputorum]
MTLPGMRVAVLAAMLGGATPSALAVSDTDVTWMFASHKPLMQSLGGAADTGPVAESASARHTSHEGGAALDTRDMPDDGARHVQTASVAEPAAMELALQPSDGRVSQAVRRYAERNGWQLAWEIERDFPIEYPATFRGDFLGIVEQIVRSLQNTDAPIRVKVYEANRVLRVVHATQ